MIEILDWKPHNKNSLLGFCNIKIPKWGNFIIYGISVFQKNSHKWIAFPSKMVAEDKSEYNSSGKPSYYPHCKFEDSKMMKSFEQEVLKALEHFQPQDQPQEQQMEIPF